MLRYAVQCRLRRQQYKDSLEMQVETVAETSFMNRFPPDFRRSGLGNLTTSFMKNNTSSCLASKNHDRLFHDQQDEGADEHVVPPGARLARAIEEV